MSELKNWDVYSSDEEVEKFEELETKQEEEVNPKPFSEKEQSFLEKFLPVAENSLDEYELVNLFREYNFDEAAIRQVIIDQVKFIKAKGSDYGWKEYKKDKKGFQVPETKPTFTFNKKKEGYQERDKAYKKSDKTVKKYEKNYKYASKNKNLEVNQEEIPKAEEEEVEQNRDNYYYNRPYYNRQYNYSNRNYNNNYYKPKNYKHKQEVGPKKRHQKLDIFQLATEDTLRREKEFKAKEGDHNVHEENAEYEKDLTDFERLNLSKTTEETPNAKPLDDKSENKETLQIESIPKTEENQIIKQSFTIGAQETKKLDLPQNEVKKSGISEVEDSYSDNQRQNLFNKFNTIQSSERQPQVNQFGYPNQMDPHLFPVQGFPPQFMMPPFQGYNSQMARMMGPGLQPTMDQMAQMYYYNMWLNQMYSQGFPQGQFKK